MIQQRTALAAATAPEARFPRGELCTVQPLTVAVRRSAPVSVEPKRRKSPSGNTALAPLPISRPPLVRSLLHLSKLGAPARAAHPSTRTAAKV
jgi:hypothetical protein